MKRFTLQRLRLQYCTLVNNYVCYFHLFTPFKGIFDSVYLLFKLFSAFVLTIDMENLTSS